MDLSKEPAAMHARYGTQPGTESFANNCLLARRLAERGVRYIQLYHWGWDSHGTNDQTNLKTGFAEMCRTVDQPIGALLSDLKDRGLLDETLVVWGGEFGRTPMRENRGGQEMKFVGRDHHPGAFTIWMAGGGAKPGFSYGETDEVGYTVAKDPVEVRDLQATVVRLLGFDHHKLSMPFQGLDQKITGVKQTRIIREVIA
jgi:arylsulfatase A-like enzyme